MGRREGNLLKKGGDAQGSKCSLALIAYIIVAKTTTQKRGIEWRKKKRGKRVRHTHTKEKK
jgi:hypothetical protein